MIKVISKAWDQSGVEELADEDSSDNENKGSNEVLRPIRKFSSHCWSLYVSNTTSSHQTEDLSTDQIVFSRAIAIVNPAHK